MRKNIEKDDLQYLIQTNTPPGAHSNTDAKLLAYITQDSAPIKTHEGMNP